MKRLLPAIALCMLLAACTKNLMVRGPNSDMRVVDQTVSSEASMQSEPQSLEYGDGDAVSSTGSLLGNDNVGERILPTGIVEFGDPAAPVVLLLYTHHSCAYCHTFTDERLPNLLRDFVDRGKVRIQIAQLNISKYPQSQAQTKSLICAAAQGKGLAMHKELFNQTLWDDKAMLALAKKVGIKETVFTDCLKAPGTASLAQLQQSLAQSLGVSLVPTYFVDGEKFVGLPQYPDLRGRIEAALSKR